MTPDPQTPPTTSLSTVLTRVFWTMVGPMALFLLLTGIVTNNNGWFTPADVGFLAVLIGLILARVVEFQGGNPRTASGDPATPAHLRKYIIATLIFGLCVWVVANMIANSK